MYDNFTLVEILGLLIKTQTATFEESDAQRMIPKAISYRQIGSACPDNAYIGLDTLSIG